MKNDTDNVFDFLDEKTLIQLEKVGVKKSFQNQELLFQKGDESDYLYYVLKGSILVVSFSLDGKEKIYNTLTKGQTCGELSILDDGTRTANAYVLPDSQLLLINKTSFRKFLDNNPYLYKNLTVILCKRLRYISENTEDTYSISAKNKVAKKLIYIFSEQISEDCINISQEELAKMVGISRETTNIILNNFVREDMIELSRKKIKIKNLPLLKEMAN